MSLNTGGFFVRWANESLLLTEKHNENRQPKRLKKKKKEINQIIQIPELDFSESLMIQTCSGIPISQYKGD